MKAAVHSIISEIRQNIGKPTSLGERACQLTLSDQVSLKLDLRFAKYLISALSILKLSIRAESKSKGRIVRISRNLSFLIGRKFGFYM